MPLVVVVRLPNAIVALVRTESPAMLALYAIVLWVLVTIVRVVWVYPGTYLPPLLAGLQPVASNNSLWARLVHATELPSLPAPALTAASW